MGGRKGKRLPTTRPYTKSPERADEAAKAVTRLIDYHERGMSYSELARITGTAVSSVRRWILGKGKDPMPGKPVAQSINAALDKHEGITS